MASLLEPQFALKPSGAESADASAWKPRSALVGTLLANRYRISEAVGVGSTGAVFRADDVISGKPVAVRVLVPSLAQQPGLISRIRARIERNAAITSRDPQALVNLVDIFEVGMTLEGEVFVVTDFIDGDHLATMLARGGRLPWSRARTLLVRLCQIVHGLHHEGIVLGALGSRNCYAVRNKNKQEAIKVFSTALLEQLAGTIGPHAGHGATILARYVSPEQACGEPIDARSDVYSLGVIAYELLTGSVPFTDTNPVRLVSMHLQRPPRPPSTVAPDAQIPPEVEAALLRSLAKEPEDRFRTVDEFGDALAAIPESAVRAGADGPVPASLAASEIPHRVEPTATTPGVAAATLAITNATSPPADDPRAEHHESNLVAAFGLASTIAAGTAGTAASASSSTPAGSPGVAAATLAVTNATSPPADDRAHDTHDPHAASPGVAAATLAITNATSPPAEDHAHPGQPGVAAATLAVTNATSPPAEDANAPVHAPPSEPPQMNSGAPVPVRRVGSIPTHVTLPPGGLSASAIHGTPAPAPAASGPARPPTFAPGGLGLRLPPPPSLGRPATIPPGAFVAPPLGAPPTLGGGVPTPVARAPSTALPRPPTLAPRSQPAEGAPATSAPRPPSAALPAGTLLRSVGTLGGAITVPSDSSPGTAVADAQAPAPVPSDSPAAAVPSDRSPAPVTPTLSDSLGSLANLASVTAAASANAAAATTESAAASTSSAPAPSASTSTGRATRDDEQRASTSGSRRAVIRLTEVRNKGDSDSAASSGTYVRTAIAEAPEAAPAKKPEPEARPVVSDDALRSAALQRASAAPVPATLSQVTGTTESLVAEVPNRRAGWIVGGLLVAAAGIAALVFTSPSVTGERNPPLAQADVVAPKDKLAATPTVPVEPEPEVEPPPADTADRPPADRGAAVLAPTTDPGAGAGSDPVNTLVPPVEPEPDPDAGTKTDKPGKKDAGKKPRKPRTPVEPEEPEKDVFDQLREHMAAKKAAEKAAEEAYRARLAAPSPSANPGATATPPPAPTPKPEAQSDAEKAKETLERAKQASSTGNPQLGYSLAKQSYTAARSQEALEIMGICACRLKNAENARSAAKALSGSPRREAVVTACNATGITL